MEKFDEKDGVWRTISGRKVFIKDGESVESAMSRSGKFKGQMSRVEKNKSKYDKIDDFKRKKATNNKIDVDKPKYHADKTGTRFEMDEEDREKAMKKLGLDRGDKKAKEFDTNEDGTKWKMRDDVREQYEKKLGLRKYREEAKKTDNKENYDDEPTPIKKGNAESDNINDQKRVSELAIKWEQAKDKDEKQRISQEINNILKKYRKDDFVVKKQNDNKYIVERKEEKEKDKDFDRRGALMKFTQDHKDQIDKWVSEYDDETHKRVGEKVRRGEGLTAKEYFGFLGSDMKAGSVILEEFADGENAVVANDGNWVRESRVKEYNKNPKAHQDAVYTDKEEDLKWEKLARENPLPTLEEFRNKYKNAKNPFRDDEFVRKEIEREEKIERYKKRRASNK